MTNEKTIDFHEAIIKQKVEEMRPPVHIREELDIGYTFEKNTVELFEIRPRWDKRDEQIHSKFAKSRFIKSQGIWKIYWMRASGKWELYEPFPEVKDVGEFFAVVKEDKHSCFFG